MAIQYVGGTTGTGTGASYTVSLSGTLTGGLASSPSTDDLIVVFTGHGGTASSAPTCSGNTSGAYFSAHTAVYANDNTGWDTNFGTFYQFAGATPDTTLTIGRTNSTTYGASTVVMVFRGAGAITTASTASGTNGGAVNPPSVTPATAGAWVLAGGTGMLAAADTAGMTAISNMTAVVNAYGNGSTSDASTIAGYYSGWTSGAFDPAAATGGNLANTSSSWAASTLVLNPPNASLSTITEDFEGTLDTSKWNTYNPGVGTVTFTGGELVLTPDQTNTFSAILYSGSTFPFCRLDSTGAYAKLTRRLTTANTAVGGYTDFNVYHNDDQNTFVGFRVTTAGVLIARTVSAGTVTSQTTISSTWDTDGTPWLKLTKSAGVVTWWTAPGGSTPGTWTSRVTNSSLPATFELAKVWFTTEGDDWVTTGALTGAAKFDGFNTATSPGTDVALTGQSVSTSRGTLAPSADVALTGQSAAISRGILGVGMALTGQAVSTTAGVVASSSSITLVGQAAIASKGALTLTSDIALVGTTVTPSQGTITPSVGQSVALVGQALTATRGSLATSVDIPLAGQTVTAARGAPSPATAISIGGQSMSASRGTLTPSTSVALAGNSVTPSAGTLTVSGATLSLSTLTEDFTAATLDTGKWVWDPKYNGTSGFDSSAAYDITSGVFHFKATSTAAFDSDGRLRTVSNYSADAGTYLRARVDLTATNSNLIEFQMALGDGTFSDQAVSKTSYVGLEYSEGVFYRQVRNGGTLAINRTDVTYSATNHAWWQIRFDATNIYLDTAPDASGSPGTFTTLDTIARSTVSGWSLGNVKAQFVRRTMSTALSSTSDGIVGLDNINAAAGTSVALTGQVITASRGSMVPAVGRALTGQVITASRGSFAVGSGAALQDQAGSTLTDQASDPILATAPADNLSVTLTGQAVTASRGSIQPGLTATLTGQAVTASRGSVSPSNAISLSGQGVSVSAGLLSTGGASTIALAGQSITVASGLPTPYFGLILDGSAIIEAISSASASATSTRGWEPIQDTAGAWTEVSGPETVWTTVEATTTAWSA